MAKYYYSKHLSVANHLYSELGWVTASHVTTKFGGKNTGYTFSPSQGFSGYGFYVDTGTSPQYSLAYTVTPDKVIEYTSVSGIYNSDNYSFPTREKTRNLISTSYTKGAFIATVLAEDGTYPIDGVYIDGYWYVRGSIYYNPPTTPSSIIVPTLIKSGEQVSISWNSSLYQSGYRLERSLNGGTWTQITQQVGTSYIDIINKGWLTVQYRVMAYGNGGNSSYRTGIITNVVNFPEIFENFNGTYKAYEGAWENINGVWVEIDSVWENVNGIWVEL